MRTTIAIAVLLALTACEGSPYMQNYGPGGRYEGQMDPITAAVLTGAPPFRYTPPPVTQPLARQPLICSSVGNTVYCN